MNLYAYVGNDPVNATDPSGLRSSILCREDGPICQSFDFPDEDASQGDTIEVDEEEVPLIELPTMEIRELALELGVAKKNTDFEVTPTLDRSPFLDRFETPVEAALALAGEIRVRAPGLTTEVGGVVREANLVERLFGGGFVAGSLQRLGTGTSLLLSGASDAALTIHFHPSGNARPSPGDFRTSKRLGGTPGLVESGGKTSFYVFKNGQAIWGIIAN